MLSRLYLWDYRVLVITALKGRVEIKHTIDLVLVMISGNMTSPSLPSRLEMLFIPASRSIVLDIDGVLAVCTLDVMQCERLCFMTANSAIPEGDYFRFPAPITDQWRLLFSEVQNLRPSPVEVQAKIVKLINPAQQLLTSPLDPRIILCLKLMRHAITNLPDNAELAQAAGLSQSRLEHLFKEQLNCTVGLMRSALKTRFFMYSFGQHRSITASAHEVGFSDSAHFCRTFKKLLGLKPSAIFKPIGTLTIDLEATPDLLRG